MKKDERLARLADRIASGGALHLREAAGLLGVSPMTIRRDLAAVPDAFRCFGGYILPAAGDAGSGYRLDAERDAHAGAKAAACRHAAARVQPNDTVFLDCGTTTPHLVAQLPADRPITVVCYALNLAHLLAPLGHVRLVLLGGLFHPSAQTFSGDEAIRSLERLAINLAILSAGGVHAGQGVTCSNFSEVPIKQTAMRRAVRRVLVADSSKLGRVTPARFAEPGDFDEILTENGPHVMAATA